MNQYILHTQFVFSLSCVPASELGACKQANLTTIKGTA